MHSDYRCLWPLLECVQVNVRGAAQRRCAFTELPHGQLCAICSQKKAWISSRSEQTGPEWWHQDAERCPQHKCVKGGILFHTIVRICLWIRAHQMCMLCSPGLACQTICLVSVRSFDVKTVWIKTLRALINLACAWVLARGLVVNLRQCLLKNVADATTPCSFDQIKAGGHARWLQPFCITFTVTHLSTLQD